jgi:hypothetical protein
VEVTPLGQLYPDGFRLVDPPGLALLAAVLLGDVPPLDPHAVDVLPDQAFVAADHVPVIVLELADKRKDSN